VHNFSISLDGYGAGPRQSVAEPLGVGGEQLHEWIFAEDADEVDRRLSGRGTDDMARVAAGGQDVRLGGGVATIQEYARAGLLDDLHVAVVPVLLHGGERLFDDATAFDGWECVERAPSRSVTHVRLRRR
jgi:dihydrofolate reductase